MNKRRPWFRFWTEDFYDEGQHLSFQHQGVLLALMSVAWRQPDCALPDDMTWLRRAVKSRGSEPGSMAVMRGLLERFFELQADGKWHNAQLATELEAARNTSKSAGKSARKRWSKRKPVNGLGDAEAYANAMRSEQSREEAKASSPDASDDYASEEDETYDESKLDDEVPF